VDPGLRSTGYGIIDIRGNHLSHVAAGEVRPPAGTLAERLACIYRGMEEVIAAHRPQQAAIEQVFMHRNPGTAIKLGQARGVALLACAMCGLQVTEYSANRIKQATVGRGHADKRQVQYMIRRLLVLPAEPGSDAADALAVAICHGHQCAGRLPRVALQ